MKNCIIFVCLSGLCLIILSCSTTALTREGSMIRDTSINNVQDCFYIGSHKATGFGFRDTENKLRNIAAGLGGTHIIWAGQNTTDLGIVILYGRIYRCP